MLYYTKYPHYFLYSIQKYTINFKFTVHFLSYCVTYTNYSLNLFIYTKICYNFISNYYIKGAAKKWQKIKNRETLSAQPKKN